MKHLWLGCWVLWGVQGCVSWKCSSSTRDFSLIFSLCCYCWCTMTLKIGSHLRQVKHLNNVLQQWVSFSSLEHLSDYQWKQRDIMMPVWFVSSLFTVKKREGEREMQERIEINRKTLKWWGMSVRERAEGEQDHTPSLCVWVCCVGQ